MTGSPVFDRGASGRAGWRRPLLVVSAVVAATLVLGGAAARVAVGVSVLSAAAPANGSSVYPAISADGRFVAFTSDASNLVAGDTNDGVSDVFVRDRVAGTTERVSVSSTGAQANGSTFSPAISADGRFVAFTSTASNLVAGVNDYVLFGADVVVRDRVAGTTWRVSVSSSGAHSNDDSNSPAISANGRFVAFESYASNLVAGDTNNSGGVFVRDRLGGTTELVSVSSTGAPANSQSHLPAISADGRFVAFESNASNLVSGDTYDQDVFVRDRVAGTTELVSASSTGAQGNGESYSPAISADGRFVAFESDASNLVSGDTNERTDVFVRDRVAGTTELVSVSSTGAPANSVSERPAISADGRFVAFDSYASNLVSGDTNDKPDVFVRDRVAGTTERVSVSSTGAQANDYSDSATISADGRFVAFDSSKLAVDDDNRRSDVFVRDRVAGTTRLISVGRVWAPQAGRLVLRPWPARAGSLLTATMPVRADGALVASARVTCAATLAGRMLLPTTHRFSAGGARCVWPIPNTGRGKPLKGLVSATTPGGMARKRFAATVR